MKTIIYKLNEGDKRPSVGRKIRLYNKLWKLPYLGKYFYKSLIRAWGFPEGTIINKDFFCSSNLIFVSNYVSLADTFIRAEAPIYIGSGTSFSFHNTILTGTHDYIDWSIVYGKPVNIGKNCWITTNVTILPGVTIGDNTIIGAGSVVTKDIPFGVFAAGNPCKVIKKIEYKTSDFYKF